MASYLVNFEDKKGDKDGLKVYNLKDLKKEIKSLKSENYIVNSVYNEQKGVYLEQYESTPAEINVIKTTRGAGGTSTSNT